ncbi:MAG: hypothetical protein MHM6MM_009375, partial [Cercozoa sp. M6MM]
MEHDANTHDLLESHSNLTVLEPSRHLTSLLTVLRDQRTVMRDFVFAANRIIRLLLEKSLSDLEYAEKTVITPTGTEFKGVELARGVCGVSILRAGESMELALREILP